jgi:hypothetical protein
VEQGKKEIMARLVMIEWVDSAQPTSSWQHLSDYKHKDAVKCVSVGFLLHDGEDVKGLAQNMGDVDKEENIQASGITHIPTCCIKKITNLEETT